MKLKRSLTMVGTVVATVLALAAPAAAHRQILLDDTDKDPSVAPLALDGTDALTFMGVIEHQDDVRSFQFNMQSGAQVHLNLGIVDQAPENTYATADLPRMYVKAPDKTTTIVTPVSRVPVTVGSGMSFLFLHDYYATAISGTYSVTVTGAKPARFLVSTGEEGAVFDGIERGSIATREQVQAWYTTVPGTN